MNTTNLDTKHKTFKIKHVFKRKKSFMEALMKTSQIVLCLTAFAIIACTNCEPYNPEPTVIERPEDVVFVTTISGKVGGIENDIQGGCVDGGIIGLATGTYFSGDTRIIEIWQSEYIPVLMGYAWDTLTWTGSNISYTGGNGLCDSVLFTTTNQVLEGSPLVKWYLKSARMTKTGEATNYNIAKEVYSGIGESGLDTAFGGDAIVCKWEITLSSYAVHSSYGLYDTFDFKVIQGIASNTASPLAKALFIYANGDSNYVNFGTASYNYAADTSWATVGYTFQDTVRAVDTVIQVYYLTQDNKYVGWDSLDVPMTANSAYKQTVKFKLLRL